MLIENKSKFVLVHASSGHKQAVEDMLAQPAVQSRLADTKAAEEIRVLKSFFNMLRRDPERAYYGYKVSEPVLSSPSGEVIASHTRLATCSVRNARRSQEEQVKKGIVGNFLEELSGRVGTFSIRQLWHPSAT